MWLVPLNLFLFMCCALSQKGLHNQVLACPFIKRLELRFQFSEPDLKENTTRPGSLMGISCHTYICHATTSSPRQKASGRSSHPVENTSSCREQTGLLLPRLPCLAGETSEACDADAGTRVSPGGLGQGRLLGWVQREADSGSKHRRVRGRRLAAQGCSFPWRPGSRSALRALARGGGALSRVGARGGGRAQRFKGAEAAGAAARPGADSGGGSGDMCGGRGGFWLLLAAALLQGNLGAAPAALPWRAPGSRRASGWSRAATGLGVGLVPGGAGRGGGRVLRPAGRSASFPSVPARRVPEEAVQGAGQELQPAGEAGGQRLAAAYRVLLPEPPADHGCGECGVALGSHTLLSRTGQHAGQGPPPPPATCAWALGLRLSLSWKLRAKVSQVGSQ